MGTTAEKLTYLNTTKHLIKDSINALGGNLTNQSTFRSYAAALDSIYNVLPKATGTGEIVSLTPTLPSKLMLDLKGNSSQAQLTGKNKYGITSVNGYTYSSGLPSAQTANMIINSYDLNNISFTANNNNQYLIALLPTYQLLPNTNYKLSYSRTNTLVSGSSARRYIYSIDENNNYSILDQKLSGDSGNVDFEFTTTSTGKIALAFGFNNNSLSSSSVVNNLMVRLATEDNTYEQYCGGVSSPNSNYPQPVNVVSGNNNIVICGRNLLNQNNSNNGSIAENSTSETITSDNHALTSEWILCQPNTTYKLVGDFNRSRIQFKNNNGIITYYGYDSVFTTNNDTRYVRIYYYYNSSIPVVDPTTVNVALYKNDDTATTYEAYQSQTYPINLPVENLFNKNDTNITDNYYLLSDGTTTGASNFYITDYIAIQPNAIYTLSPYRNYSAYECFYDKDKIFISSVKTGDINPSFKTPSNCKYIRLSIRKSDIDEEQLEIGSKVNTYTPYGTTPIELCKIPNTDYQDSFIYNNDKWYKRADIGKKVFYNQAVYAVSDNQSSVEQTSLNGTYNIFLSNLNISVKNENMYYSYGTYKYYSTINANKVAQDTLQDNELCLRQGTTKDRIYFRNSAFTGKTGNQIKELINNALLYYVLATATDTEITDTTLINQLNAIRLNALSYNGTTNILQENNDLPFIIDASCLKGE